MRLYLYAFALWVAFMAGRAYGDEPEDTTRCDALHFTGGATQEELRAWWEAGDDAIGYDEETRCFYCD